MASPDSSPATPFGRIVTAMVTPFAADGALDLDGATALAAYLIDAGNDGLVLNGTTGEAPTTTDAEKVALIRAVRDAVGERAHIIAGVGTNDTRHSVEQAKSAQKAGAHGLLAVTPYYSRPPREGVYRHFTAIADATDLPVMLYDIPVRTGTPIETETLVRLAEHDRIVAVKDAKGDLGASSWVLARTDLAYYCGDDMLNLPLLSIGAVGAVSVASHLVTADIRAMFDAYGAGETGKARDIHRSLLPVYTGLFRTQGVITTKAALNRLGRPAGPVRLPLVELTAQQLEVLRQDLAAAGVQI
ncbi:4-hydroxy-tetrahydrodipicolinate synthase [Actinocrinis puniceicyclus]|uniref:4-hydroxy-tetrahydrodipicolinate synthase n=1 Tax=Actinocrinis puniceicyclus TaxID=977794 RepID=A0A8J8BEM3_9ACTN|nr:4-hydroxy-tetrahydrodipicolinate synthase [Actinocrinis puniceicyclus]MBS2965316.1 4-hydroxy-tetrahydrodipicolinate synthase [Actinocrinis puniceicyclus]